ncbi:MAG: HAMP domain-containing histidine kinase [Clostridiales bacterium]|nr:HAMP domain-containing histidine kinase [Clostridiales bacterium]
MIKKLRIKLIAASMASLFLVLFVIGGMVGILNYRKIVRDADRILEILEENAGSFPKMFHGNRKNDQMGMSPEIPYESRYFSVLLDEKGSIILVDTSKTVSIDTEEAIEYASEVWEKEREKGFLEAYRYWRCSYNGEVRIIFLDCRRQLDDFQNFLFTTFAVSTIGLLSVFALMVYLSARIVKPFSDNYEKQKRFITDAGHELKTPLTIIDADTEILEMDFGENEWLQDIQGQTKRLADLTNALVMLSRAEEGQNRNVKVEFPLSDMVEEVFHTFQAPAKVLEKSLTGIIAPMISMNGDEKAIRGLITILLDNAVKYTNERGQISVTLEKKKNRIYLSVFNTTEHISKEQISHLFDRFYRTDTSRNSQTGGYGLGLSIAAATVDSHRGKIIAETEDEKSLRITVIFPT